MPREQIASEVVLGTGRVLASQHGLCVTALQLPAVRQRVAHPGVKVIRRGAQELLALPLSREVGVFQLDVAPSLVGRSLLAEDAHGQRRYCRVRDGGLGYALLVYLVLVFGDKELEFDQSEEVYLEGVKLASLHSGNLCVKRVAVVDVVEELGCQDKRGDDNSVHV